jgi:prepilin-type N-terminal cleavage/methylation domain-containing protein
MGEKSTEGFTLIELAIVLVIIGLIVGGVLVGRDLIRAAEVRATISQLEKYQTAVNTFRGKYNAIPGDMEPTTAAKFGFQLAGTNGSNDVRGSFPGTGDGNGMIEGFGWAGHVSNCGQCIGAGEPVLFWDDLTYANGMNIGLVEGSFPPTFGYLEGNAQRDVTGTGIALFYPAAKIGGGNYIYAYSDNAVNYFGISVVYSIVDPTGYSTPGLSVAQAYNVDKKMDDGMPQSGNVIAQYVNNNYTWSGPDNGPTDTTTATPPSATSCYDDGGNIGTKRQYSLSQNNGAGANCALSFKFQ